MKKTMIALGILAAFSGWAFAAEPAKVMTVSAGKVWTDPKGMTLYTFDKDEAGKTNCYQTCATKWPPFMAAAGAKAEGSWTVVDRTDGTKMWAYEGHPLYTYIEDKAAGEIKGEGVGGVWHLAKAK